MESYWLIVITAGPLAEICNGEPLTWNHSTNQTTCRKFATAHQELAKVVNMNLNANNSSNWRVSSWEFNINN